MEVITTKLGAGIRALETGIRLVFDTCSPPPLHLRAIGHRVLSEDSFPWQMKRKTAGELQPGAEKQKSQIFLTQQRGTVTDYLVFSRYDFARCVNIVQDPKRPCRPYMAF